MLRQPPMPKPVAQPSPRALYAVMAATAVATFATLTTVYDLFFAPQLFA